MRASQPDSITKFITSNELTFVIPVYQRNYVWKIEDCEKLFDDVLECIQTDRKHYFGNLVYYEDERDPFTGYARYVLIDGQQRITSTMLLIAAIRDEESDESIRRSLTASYLTNQGAAENFRVKLKQVETDRSVYEAIIEERIGDINKSSVIYRNYNKFRNLVKNAKSEHSQTSESLLNGILNLHIIAIDLESNKESSESPQVIFESINATGEPLATADLLRNFLLLEVGIDRQKEIYENYWLVIEKNVGTDNVSDFVRRFITLQTTDDVKKDTEYREFKKHYKEYFGTAEEAIRELAKFSKYYRWIKRPETISKEYPTTSSILQDINDLRMLPATPAIMWLLDKADTGDISFEDVNNTLEVVGSWSFRARITSIISTGEIGNILTTKILELLKNKQNDQAYADYILFELSNYRFREIYPSDDVFREAFIKYDFYKNYRRYVQQKLASAFTHDQTEVVLESVEHIMPQTLSTDKWPDITVSDHAEWVNTIGNLTPLNMTDNPAASNDSFEEKKQYLAESDWQITREIVSGRHAFNSWGIAEIKKRAALLAEKATRVWRAPVKRTRDIELAQTGSKKLTQKFIDWFYELDVDFIRLDENKIAKSFLRFTSDYMDALIPPRSEKDGGWRNGSAYYYELKTDQSGWARVTLTFNSENTNSQQKAGQQYIMKTLDKFPSKHNDFDKRWKWFVPTGWTLNSDDGDEVLKDGYRKIFEEVIPSFEQELQEAEKQT